MDRRHTREAGLAGLPGRRRVVLAAAASVVTLIGMVVVLVWAAFAATAERARLDALPKPTPYSVPVKATPRPTAPADVIAALPSAICGRLDRALVPAEIRSQKPGQYTADDGDRQICLWQVYGKDQARYLTVSVQVFPDPDPRGAATKASDKFFVDKAYVNDAAGKPGANGKTRPMAGLGDDAFTNQGQSAIDSDGRTYHISGAHLLARNGNVLVEVHWQGADYPDSQNVRVLRGTGLSYDKAEAVAVALAKEAMARAG